MALRPTIEQLSKLSDEALAEWLEIQAKLAELDRYDWQSHARPEQLPPQGEWNVWLIMAGRGWGKTRTGAEWIKAQALANPRHRYAIVAPTFGDARDTCIEGESGLLSILPEGTIGHYNRSMAELTLSNGARIKGFGATEPDRLRGPQHHGAWCDELAAWPYPETWDQMQFGLRLGKPRTVVTTTPRPTKLVKSLYGRSEGIVVTTGNTFDNAANLAPSALAELLARYEGTRMGRQELYAELLTDNIGALWSYDLIDACRVTKAPDLARVVVAIDPAVTSGEDSDLTGLVVAGVGTDGLGYVLADRSGRYSPDTWGRKAVAAYNEFGADRIVAEVNNGGDLVANVIRTVAPDVSYKSVSATRAKRTRAEPVAALYEQHKVHHVGALGDLEDQLCNWTPETGTSPDRLDALVWGITELMLNSQAQFLGAA